MGLPVSGSKDNLIKSSDPRMGINCTYSIFSLVVRGKHVDAMPSHQYKNKEDHTTFA